MRISTYQRIVVSVAVTAAAATGCGSDDGGGIATTLADFSITTSSSSAAAGEVTFDVDNTADQVHELVVARTSLDAADLPTGEDGDVSEEGAADLTVVDEIEDIAPDDSPQLVVDLTPGHYVLFCNLPGHYRQGMHANFDVTGS